MWQGTYLEKNVYAPFAVLQGMALLLADAKTTSAYFIGLSSIGPPKIGPLRCIKCVQKHILSSLANVKFFSRIVLTVGILLRNKDTSIFHVKYFIDIKTRNVLCSLMSSILLTIKA